jgi:uncharacterized protein YbcV (DUF1398 family)
MFTISEITAADLKVKTYNKYPEYVQELIKVGILGYEAHIEDGNTIYYGHGGYKIQSGPKYHLINVAGAVNLKKFNSSLRAYKLGKTDFLNFCKGCAEAGIHKWLVDTNIMTFVYYDKEGNEVHIEDIPIM